MPAFMSEEIRSRRQYGYISPDKPRSTPQTRGGRFFRRKKSPKGPKKQRFKKYWPTILRTGLIVGVIGLIGMVGAAVWVSKDLPNPNELGAKKTNQSTKIYDRTGSILLYEEYYNEKRTLVKYEDLPKNLINGIVATEDKTFFKHIGVRPLSILRAGVMAVVNRTQVRGTSTITQQLVKNVILNNERSPIRKFKEIVLALRLEQKFSKEEILQIYFNEISYGSTIFGVETAAQTYLHKSIKDVTLAEAALLAGMTQQPSRFMRDFDALKVRRDFVLRRMYEEGYITEDEKNKAQAEPSTLDLKVNNIRAPHFVFSVIEQLEEKYGADRVNTGGLKVITTLDWTKQEIAEKTIAEEAQKTFAEAGVNNAALISIDPKTGEILAMVGSRDFFNDEIKGKFNVALDGRRQPGSSIKPIIYAAAFEKGYTPDTVLFDVVTNFASTGDGYTPLNYDLGERGLVTLRSALQGSLNIPAVKTFYLVGEKQGITFAERMGYTTFSKGDFGLSLVLGGGGVSMLEHVGAYGVFANRGVRHTPVSILKVEDDQGTVLSAQTTDQGEEVLKPEVADTITSVLSDDAARAYIFGAGGILTLPDRPVAAKTGTTNEYRDAWTVGYTPSLVTVVWAGNTDNEKMKAGYGGSRLAGQMWNRFMRESLKGTPVEEFTPPPPNDAEKPVLRGGQGGITLMIDGITGKLATSSTPESYIVRRTFVPPHDILHYVNKDDPRGPVPEDPNVDPQYAIWEAAVQDWIRRSKEKDPTWDVSFEEPPTEFDDVHSLELVPHLEVVVPTPSTTLSSRLIQTDIRVSAPRGVTKVTYKIDSVQVAIVREHPFNLSHYAYDLQNGPHTLTILVEDDIGNTHEARIPFTLSAGEEPPGVVWVGGNQRVSTRDFPQTFFLIPVQKQRIKSISVVARGSSGDIPVGTITDLTSLFEDQLFLSWKEAPPPGTWTLVASVTDTSNTTRESGRTTITVQ